MVFIHAWLNWWPLWKSLELPTVQSLEQMQVLSWGQWLEIWFPHLRNVLIEFLAWANKSVPAVKFSSESIHFHSLLPRLRIPWWLCQTEDGALLSTRGLECSLEPATRLPIVTYLLFRLVSGFRFFPNLCAEQLLYVSGDMWWNHVKSWRVLEGVQMLQCLHLCRVALQSSMNFQAHQLLVDSRKVQGDHSAGGNLTAWCKQKRPDSCKMCKRPAQNLMEASRLHWALEHLELPQDVRLGIPYSRSAWVAAARKAQAWIWATSDLGCASQLLCVAIWRIVSRFACILWTKTFSFFLLNHGCFEAEHLTDNADTVKK